MPTDLDAFVETLARLAHRSPPRIRNTRNGLLVADLVVTARDSAARRRGLVGRDRLEEGTALVIAPSSAIHTFFMRFAIDVAFVDADGRVVKTVPALRPWRIAAAPRAAAVIELPAGALSRAHVRRGDLLHPEAFGA